MDGVWRGEEGLSSVENGDDEIGRGKEGGKGGTERAGMETWRGDREGVMPPFST